MNKFKEIYFIVRNTLIIPSIRCLLFSCVGIQAFVAFYELYIMCTTKSWITVYDITENISGYFRRIIECLIAFFLFFSLVETKTSFFEAPKISRVSLFENIGFRSVWMGMATFYSICTNINDSQALKFLSESIKTQEVRKLSWVSYITCGTAGFCFVYGFCVWLYQMPRRCCTCCGLYEPAAVEVEADAHPEVKWTAIEGRMNRLLMLVYYVFMLSLPLFVIVIQVMYLVTEGKGVIEKPSTFLQEEVWSKLGQGDFIIVFLLLRYFLNQFWYRPYQESKNIIMLLYAYLLFNVYSKAGKYNAYFIQHGWDITDDMFRKVVLWLVITYIVFPICFWILFIFGSTRTDTIATSLLKRIYQPIADLFREYMCRREKRFAMIYTVAVLCGMAGGISTSFSQSYELLDIDFTALDEFKQIHNDILHIKEQIINVSNGFIIVAANLNPCMDYSVKYKKGHSIDSLIATQVSTKGKDGHAGSNPDMSKSVLQQLYDESEDKKFKKDCFKYVNNTLVYSGNTKNSDCKNVKHLADVDFETTQLKTKKNANVSRPDCSTPEKCLKTSDDLIPGEYKLESNGVCEDVACGIFISGITAAFAASFVPFAGPAIAKGLQISLRTVRGIKKFGTVFKRVGTQVKSKLKTIKDLVRTIGKIVSPIKPAGKPSYHFYYFIAPSLLLMIIAFGLGFFKRKADYASKPIFLMFFLASMCVCGTFTFLSFVFTELLSKFIMEPFSSFSIFTIKSSVGMKMINWGYLLATVSSALFLFTIVSSEPDADSKTEKGRSNEQNESNSITEKEISKKRNESNSKTEKEISKKRNESNSKTEKEIGKMKHKEYNSRFQSEFPRWLTTFLITLPVYYLLLTCYWNNFSILEVQLKPTPALEEIRTKFGQTDALEREFGSIDDLDGNDNLCDIVSAIVKAVIDNLKLPIPGIGSIKGLFAMNTGIRRAVAEFTENVRKVFTIDIGGFNLLEGVHFPSLKMVFEAWQAVLVFAIPVSINIGSFLCFCFTLIQQIGFLRENQLFGQVIIPFFEQSMMTVSICSIFVQTSLIGLFSLMDGFDTPMFSFAVGVGELIVYGVSGTVMCIIASIFHFLGQYAPIANEDEDEHQSEHSTLMLTTGL